MTPDTWPPPQPTFRDRIACLLGHHKWVCGTLGHTFGYMRCERCWRQERTTVENWWRLNDSGRYGR